jgi:hypothetical protein
VENEVQYENREVSSPEAISVPIQDEPTAISASTVDTNVVSSSDMASTLVQMQKLSQADTIHWDNQAAILIQTAFRAFLVFVQNIYFSQNDLFMYFLILFQSVCCWYELLCA